MTLSDIINQDCLQEDFLMQTSHIMRITQWLIVIGIYGKLSQVKYDEKTIIEKFIFIAKFDDTPDIA